MNRKLRTIILFTFSIVLALGVYAFMMYGLADFNDPNNADNGLRVDEANDLANREGFGLIDLNSSSFADVGRAVGNFIWQTRGIDVILVGVILFVASESAATVVKGIEDQCGEFRAEMCDTTKFIILEEQEAEKEEAD